MRWVPILGSGGSGSSAAWVAGQSRADPLGLDTAESLEFLGLHRDSTAESNLAGSALDERDTVGVQRFVNRSSARLSAGDGNAGGCDCGGSTFFAVFTETLDDSSLHGELDPIQGHEPDNVPDPDDTDPSSRDSPDVGEAPVTVSGDDRRDQLSNSEGNQESSRGAFHEEEAVRTGDEDQSLRDDGNLEVDNHVELRVVGLDGEFLERDTEPVLEESSLHDNDHQGDSRQG